MKPLTRGRIAATDGSFGVGDLDDVVGQNTLNGSPSSAVNIRRRGTLPSGQRWAAGEMARRYEDRVQVPDISSDGDVSVTHEDDVLEEYSAFALVPGEFAIAWEDWAFKYLVHNYPVWEYHDQHIRVNGFYEDKSFNDVSSVGFAHRTDRAEKGTVHGQQVTKDEGLGEDLRDGSYLNELRYSHFPDGFGTEIQAYVAASGYVEVYNPSDMETGEYLRYVREFIAPHTEDADTDGDADA